MPVEDAGIIVYVNKVPEWENFLCDTIVETGEYLWICFSSEIELYFVSSESSHPKKDINQILS